MSASLKQPSLVVDLAFRTRTTSTHACAHGVLVRLLQITPEEGGGAPQRARRERTVSRFILLSFSYVVDVVFSPDREPSREAYRGPACRWPHGLQCGRYGSEASKAIGWGEEGVLLPLRCATTQRQLRGLLACRGELHSPPPHTLPVLPVAALTHFAPLLSFSFATVPLLLLLAHSPPLPLLPPHLSPNKRKRADACRAARATQLSPVTRFRKNREFRSVASPARFQVGSASITRKRLIREHR